MSEDRPVVSAEIPEFTGNLEQLETDAGDIAFDGMAVGAAGLLIDANFNLLEPFYKAPEADQLFATTAPVAAAGHDLQTELSTVSKALLDYAAEVRPLVDRLDSLREEAAAFERRVADDDDWVADGDLIEENTSRRSAVNAAWAAFQAAELACHNKIVALVGGEPLVVGDGSNKKNMYGYRAEDLDHAGGLPWGDVVEESNPWYYFHEHAWDFTVGFFVDGVWGTIRGLGTLVGVDGWDAAGQAWTGLGKLLTGIVITAVPVVGAAYWLAPDDKLPSWLRDSRTAVVETGKALIAYDEWGKNPSRAAGAVTFNVLTTVFTGGAGGAVAGTGKAGAIAKAISFAGRAGRIVDPMTYLAKGVGGAAVRISDVMAGLRGITNGTHIRLGEGTYRIADVPNITDDLPAGLTPENSVRMTTPEGQVVYLDTKTLVMHNADGTVRESLDGIRHEATAEQRAGDGVRQEGAGAGRGEREVVGAGARAHVGDSAGVGGRGGDDVVGTGGRAGEEPPVGRGGSGGRAGGGMDDLGHGGDDAVGNGPDHGTGAGGGAGTGAAGGARPDFMREGGDPYGPRGSLTREQIEEIQVYRANNEPGYREHYYRKDGTRKSLELYDESGQTPPQLTRVSENSPWVRAKDVPAPPKPHFLDDKYIGVGADTVSSRARLRLLEESARTRHLAIQWDNLMSEWKAETGRAHEIRQTHESAGLWGEAKGSYKESHTAMGGAAEALGENAARHHYIAERYPDFTDEPLLGPKSGNDQFDQVWTHEDGRVVVIEAKSSPGTDFGRRTLPNGKQVSQGSREYFYDILEAMKSRGEFDVVEAIERAIEDNKFEYTVVKGEKNAGTYTGYQYRRFDISKGTLP
ncbi:hypothetical protein [Streptomyces stelliscabiei]|uniref:Uncharacterized protein n=3 Tax=Streptomyces stelliscabiei TaxID=146820 RepID=A0A8I0P705_9ACTN|nr:hypothetical protein [Streptomyces stelliscabiei]KND41193.1 hypothetical protein IQ64_30530 [Streptomyces stelliscabiei]MBE1598329.1 hypothetical protein [Streptomyces stelliscabiei]MDX2521987.1 hypothetical protein [Streptomyces stelliscabiei]MDX2556047.1 hypothetical protein [Streptomyces stelliscabiei]MDX2617656.1 hypothetical protein [Streptomyces stelliscabiei]